MKKFSKGDFQDRKREYDSQKSNYRIVESSDNVFYMESKQMGYDDMWHRSVIPHKTQHAAELFIEERIENALKEQQYKIVKTFE